MTYQSAFPQVPHILPEQQKGHVLVEGVSPSFHHLIKTSLAVYPSFVWPVELDLYDRLGVANYVDEDPGGGITDYEGEALRMMGTEGRTLRSIVFV